MASRAARPFGARPPVSAMPKPIRMGSAACNAVAPASKAAAANRAPHKRFIMVVVSSGLVASPHPMAWQGRWQRARFSPYGAVDNSCQGGLDMQDLNEFTV